MTDKLQIIRAKLIHLAKMQSYLAYSHGQVAKILPLHDWTSLTPAQDESLSAFRLRFSEFQQHIGKAMRAVAIEEEQEVERFGAVLALMERLEVLDSTEHWKRIRDLRNAVNHEYEDDSLRLAKFFELRVAQTPVLFDYLNRLTSYCAKAYGIGT